MDNNFRFNNRLSNSIYIMPDNVGKTNLVKNLNVLNDPEIPFVDRDDDDMIWDKRFRYYFLTVGFYKAQTGIDMGAENNGTIILKLLGQQLVQHIYSLMPRGNIRPTEYLIANNKDVRTIYTQALFHYCMYDFVEQGGDIGKQPDQDLRKNFMISETTKNILINGGVLNLGEMTNFLVSKDDYRSDY
jgi:hypothetical protein